MVKVECHVTPFQPIEYQYSLIYIYTLSYIIQILTALSVANLLLFFGGGEGGGGTVKAMARGELTTVICPETKIFSASWLTKCAYFG